MCVVGVVYPLYVIGRTVLYAYIINKINVLIVYTFVTQNIYINIRSFVNQPDAVVLFVSKIIINTINIMK